MSWVDRIVSTVTERSRLVIAVMIVLTLVVGGGMASVGESSQVALADDSETAAANDFVAENFSQRDANTTTAVIAVEHEDGNVLSRESLVRELEYQHALVTNESVNETLVEEESIGIANIVAGTAIAEREDEREQQQEPNESRPAAAERGDSPPDPTIDEQIAQLESMTDDEVAAIVERLGDPDSDHPQRRTVQSLLPRSYEPGSATADARLLVVTAETEDPVQLDAAVSDDVAESQLAARDLAQSQPGPETYRMVGSGLVGDREDAAIEDSLGIVGPLALLFVLVALSIAYRDPLDIALGVLGVVTVLVWTFGVMGWAGIAFNQVMVAIPILLIGLSVDYAFHVIMRYREEYDGESDATGDSDVRDAMARSLHGVGPALALVTITTAIGFLANLASPVDDLRAFGVVAAIGIGATVLAFGLFVPALKVELDASLADHGWDRSARAFGTGGRLETVLGGSARLARRAPVAIVVITLLVTAGGAVGASHLETSADPNAFLADEPPAWTEELPAGLEPGEFYLKDNREFIYSNFQTPDQQGEILIEGNVTDPGLLAQLATAESEAAKQDVTVDRATGEPAVESPLSAMERTAADDEEFNDTFHAADTSGDGVPDRNVEAVYNAFFEANPSLATQYVHRTESNEYAAVRLRMAVDGNAAPTTIDSQVTDVAATIETGDDRQVTPTGGPLVTATVVGQLTSTIVWSVAVTIGAIVVLLAVVFRRTEGSASLGTVTFLPVVCAMVWLLATLVVLDIPIGQITAFVGSISLGLGVDYTIHVTRRFTDELGAEGDPALALRRTVVGTGGALLSSAVTTAAGFGVLAFGLLPGLRQFGLSLALGVSYAFLASILVLPSMLALWARYSSGTVTPTDTTATIGDD